MSMTSHKLQAGDVFPQQTVTKLGGGEITLGKPENGHDWQMIVVYRGKHCPICTGYLGELNEALGEFNSINIDVVAVSADPVEKASAQLNPINPAYSVGHDLSITQMHELGLYISNPRSPEETDRPFSEPGLFIVNDEGRLQVTDISNAPFARPQLSSLAMGMKFLRNPENNYPIRGTHT